MGTKGHILLINPWIYDFAAHNLWIEPLGLLTIAAALRDSGYDVTVIDCLAPHPGAPRPRPDGSGKFLKTLIDKPVPVAMVPRHYGRYGLPLEQFDAALSSAPTPDLVLVASGMTYWYPGAFEAIQRVRARLGAVPLALGGVYATLCPAHARQHSGADSVIEGPGLVAALRLADEVTGHDSKPARYADPRRGPPPAHELVTRPFAGIATSWGCAFRCTYCASHHLQPVFVQQEPSAVVDEIAFCVRRGIREFAFYDDALLLDAGQHAAPILEDLLARGLQARFHSPNGLHAREITAGLAVLMRRAGFASVRLSLETTDAARQQTTGGKVTTDAFERATMHLQAAGFGPGELAAYILVGLPGQPLSEVETSIRYVHRLGVQAKLALFSPIPGTLDGDEVLPLGADPLLHNNTVYPYLQGPGYAREIQRLKSLAKEGNATLAA
jgi:radical SAM superfamily enzyme YgiQ (UPF0313 family)